MLSSRGLVMFEAGEGWDPVDDLAALVLVEVNCEEEGGQGEETGKANDAASDEHPRTGGQS